MRKSFRWSFLYILRNAWNTSSQEGATSWTSNVEVLDLYACFPSSSTAFDINSIKLCQSIQYNMLYQYINSPFIYNRKIVTFSFGHSCFLFCELPIRIFEIFEMVMWLFFSYCILSLLPFINALKPSANLWLVFIFVVALFLWLF